jgi:hypothetical protein
VGVGGLGFWGIPLCDDTFEEPKDVCPSQTLQRGEWQDPMLVEAVLSMLTMVCHCKRVIRRVWAPFHSRLAFTLAAFNTIWNAVCRVAQVQGRTPHSARHAMGKHIIAKTGNIASVQKQLGHRQAAYAMQYARTTPEALAQVLDDR